MAIVAAHAAIAVFIYNWSLVVVIALPLLLVKKVASDAQQIVGEGLLFRYALRAPLHKSPSTQALGIKEN